MSKDNIFGIKSKKFVRQFFKAYFENGDFEVVKSMLHSNVSWIDVVTGEIYEENNISEFLESAKEIWQSGYKLADENYNTIEQNENSCVVFGTLKLDSKDAETLFAKAKICCSMVCALDADSIKLSLVHFLMQDEEHMNQKYSYEVLSENYNLLLKQKLRENTALLEEKTLELEAITSNIIGGLHICEMDVDFTLVHFNEGFLRLTGYYREEIQSALNNKFAPVIYHEDIEKVKSEIAEQTKNSDTFSIVYRIIKKDGSLIWVLDKGNVFTDDNNKTLVQCFLTDTTEQKKQEELTNISKQRYEILLQQLDITMFEYNIETKELIFFDDVANMYDVPKVLEDGPRTFVKKGIISKECADEYLAMYEKIHAGAAFASCIITAVDANAKSYDFHLTLTTVFDLMGKPVRAIGIRKNISEIRKLERDREFSKTFVSDKLFVCEIDISNYTILEMNEDWMNKLNIKKGANFFEVLNLAKNKLVAKDYQDLFLERVSQKYITDEYNIGTRMYSFEYRRNLEDDNFLWYRATINIIKDEITGNLRVRYYTTDITEEKEKENEEIKNKFIYDNMLSKAKLMYEVNISKNCVIKGHEHWKENFGIVTTSSYDEMLDVFANKVVFKKDVPEFLWKLNRTNAINCFKKGDKQVVCEYRRMKANRACEWMKCTFHLYQDPVSKDIKGYSYVENIDKQKREEIDLKYKARHDVMTNLLNKECTQKEIEMFLKNSVAKSQIHAFLIVDIDYFKNLNDTMGHLFGDDVLIEIGKKLRSVFRKEDIIGRIGGDEFVVFMKNIDSKELAVKKADELCKKIFTVYECEGKTCNISASVGIALYTKHGSTYKSLYKHADAALYVAKDNGRNQYYM